MFINHKEFGVLARKFVLMGGVSALATLSHGAMNETAMAQAVIAQDTLAVSATRIDPITGQADYTGDVRVNTLTVDANAHFRGGIEEFSGTGPAAMRVHAGSIATFKPGVGVTSMTIDAAIDGNAANSGTIQIEEPDGGHSRLTFRHAIGGNRAVQNLTIMTGSGSLETVFEDDVTARSMAIIAAPSRNTTTVFRGNVDTNLTMQRIPVAGNHVTVFVEADGHRDISVGHISVAGSVATPAVAGADGATNLKINASNTATTTATVTLSNIGMVGGNHSLDMLQIGAAGNVDVDVTGTGAVFVNNLFVGEKAGKVTLGQAHGGILEARLGATFTGGHVTMTKNNQFMSAGDVTVGRPGGTGAPQVEFHNLHLSADKHLIIAESGAHTKIRGTLTGGGVHFTADGTVTAHKGIKGAVSTAQDGEGKLVLHADGAARILGEVGEDTLRLNEITVIADAADAPVIGNGTGVFADHLKLTGTAPGLPGGDLTVASKLHIHDLTVTNGGGLTFNQDAHVSGDIIGAPAMTVNAGLTFDGLADQTVSGAITGTGTLHIHNLAGEVLFDDPVGNPAPGVAGGMLDVHVKAGARAYFSDTLSAGILTMGAGSSITLTGSNSAERLVLSGNAASINVGAGTVVTDTALRLTGAGTNLNGKTISVAMPDSVQVGNFTFLDTNRPTDIAGATFNVSGSGAFQYSVETGSGDVVIVVSTAAPVLTAAPAAAPAATPAAAPVVTVAEPVVVPRPKAKPRKAPHEVLGGYRDRDLALSGHTPRMVQERLGALRTNLPSGFGAGDATDGVTPERRGDIWARPFAQNARQDARNGSPGYDAKTFGLAMGADSQITENSRIGIALTGLNVDVNGAGENRHHLTIEGQQISAYADYSNDDFYVEGLVGYGFNKNRTARYIAATGRTAEGSFNSNHLVVSARGGVPLDMGDNLFVTPEGGLTWTRLMSGSYTETGAGTDNMRIKQKDIDVLDGRVGLSVRKIITGENGDLFVPELRAGMSYDLAGEKAEIVAQYADGGPGFTIDGKQGDRLTFDVGAGLTWDSGDFSIGADYDAEFRAGYVSHNLTVNVTYRF